MESAVEQNIVLLFMHDLTAHSLPYRIEPICLSKYHQNQNKQIWLKIQCDTTKDISSEHSTARKQKACDKQWPLATPYDKHNPLVRGVWSML